MDAPLDVEPLRLRRIPMLLAAACFAAGIALARLHWHTPTELLASALLLFALTLWSLRQAPRVAWTPVLALLLLAGCWCTHLQQPVGRQTALLGYADGLSRSVRGTVTEVRAAPESASSADPDATQPPGEPWLADPGAWEPEAHAPRASVDLQVSAVEDVTPDVSSMQPVAGGVRVTLGPSVPPLHCGDIVEVPLRLREPDTYRDPGAWSYSDALLEQGIVATASAGTGSRPARLLILGHAPAGWACRLLAARMWASTRLHTLVGTSENTRLPRALQLSEADAAMLAAMLFGDRRGLSRELRTGFERTGTFHLFVVSGLHVALLAGGMLWLLRRLRLPYPLAVLLSLATAAGYALLTGWGVPVQRALGMTALYMLARLLARTGSPLNALGAAALAVLALDPRALTTASFQMTFLVIFAIAGLAAPLEQRIFGRLRQTWHELPVLRLDAWLPPTVAARRVRLRLWGELLATFVTPAASTGAAAGSAARLTRWARALPAGLLRAACALAALLLVTLVAECCLVLPMAVYFHRATLLALPANIFCLPLIGLLLGGALLCFLTALVSAKLALLPAALTAALLHALRFVVQHVSRLPSADVRVPSPAAATLAAATLLLVGALWALRARRPAWLFTGLAMTAALPLLVLWPAPPLLHSGMLEVTALDVGQGDSLLVVTPEGRTLLVDAGGPAGLVNAGGPTGQGGNAGAPLGPTVADRWDIGEEVVAPYLWSRRIRRLDAVMLTHAHSDHMGGMPAVLRDLRPRELWLGVQPAISPGLLALRAEAAELGIRVHWFRAGDAFAWGGAQVQVLAPEPGYTNPGAAINDDSLVMRLAYGQASVLLEGDAQSRSEAAMLAQGRVARSTLLKVGHHGSKTSTTPEFLAAVAPREAIVSVGRHNTFGHPRMEVLQRLESAGIKTVRTDRAGLETFLLTADGNITAQAGP